MGRRNTKRQPVVANPHRPSANAMAEVVAPAVNEPVTVLSGATEAVVATVQQSAIEIVVEPTASSVAPTQLLAIDAREIALAEREADLRSRRREAAREIRRGRRDESKLNNRFATIESVITELTQVVVQLGQQGPASTTVIERVEPDYIVEESLRSEIQSLRDELETLSLQNEQLAGDIARSSVRQSINHSGADDATLSWEQRKAQIFAQDNPELYADASHDLPAQQEAIERLRSELQTRDAEISQLHELLEQRPIQCEEGTAVGAAAIAQLMDNDELVREERQRLQDLQTEWEGKFRKMEIAASIERANLSRERQQLERQNAELEEQLAHLKRELRQEAIAGPNQSRRWLAKLGLAD